MAGDFEGLNLDEWKNWDPKSKERFLEAVALSEKKRLVWYCKKGRTCDGKPHDEYDYKHARGDQWPPVGSWFVWMQRGGRGSGKTRCGSEWTRKVSMTIERVSIIGPTLPHVRDVMVEGESGLLAAFDNAKVKVLWEPSKRKITLPNENIIQCFTGEEPERLRGPQHGAAWLDEPAHMALIEAVWDNLLLGLRLGMDPRILCTTTPLPLKWLKELIEKPDTISVTVSTYENLDNLAPTFARTVLGKYEGTRQGRQELHGEILDDIVGALWSWEMIDDFRVRGTFDHTILDRIVVSVDPAGSSSIQRDETGIIVVGVRGDDFYVLYDGSGHYTPEGWAREAWRLYDYYDADAIVAEKNFGGEMVESTLRNARKDGRVKLVNSRRGKQLRAEPVVSLYEQERVHHVGIHEELEAQQTEWVPGKGASPDRVDALVHGITDLSGGAEPIDFASPVGVKLPGGPRGGAKAFAGMGYRPREERIAILDRMLAPRNMPYCEHPTTFEHHTDSGVLICHTCLHEVHWDGDVLVRGRA